MLLKVAVFCMLTLSHERDQARCGLRHFERDVDGGGDVHSY